MKQFWLVRHGQSEGNIDKPQAYRGAPPLTATGWRQVQQFAAWFEPTPDLIVASSFIRARQSAEPLRARFPHAAMETWPVQEFTPLASRYYEGVRMSDRREAFLQYFADADPYVDNGRGAESFFGGVERAADLFERLRNADAQTVVVFTHATFLRIVCWLWLYGGVTETAENMSIFGRLLRTHKVPNTAYLHGYVENNRVFLSGFQTDHLTA